MAKFSAMLSAHKFMLWNFLPYSKQSEPILNCRNLLTFSFNRIGYYVFVEIGIKCIISAMLELWRRAESVRGNLKKVHQILFYYRVLGTQNRRVRIARACEHKRSNRRVLCVWFMKGIFAFWRDTFFHVPNSKL